MSAIALTQGSRRAPGRLASLVARVCCYSRNAIACCGNLGAMFCEPMSLEAGRVRQRDCAIRAQPLDHFIARVKRLDCRLHAVIIRDFETARTHARRWDNDPAPLRQPSPRHEQTDLECCMKNGYDYVVVGGGSAGCVMAARLSEDPAVQVALIEAGPMDDAPEIHTPVAFPQLFKSQHDWDYSSEPEPALCGRRIYLPRGKVLGGSSSMNAMIYIRGNRADYDEWAAEGAAGWSYDDLLPYVIKSEANERGASRFHGADGPLSVQDGRSQHPLIDCIIEALVEAGFPRNTDFNGASQLGAGRFQFTQNHGLRCSAAAAYLRPARGRQNLDILTRATVIRLVLERSRAAAIEIERDGERSMIRAEREVILCAGAYNSPQILMLSGIGKPADLKALGIDPLVDLPVGDNLQDHPGLVLSYFTDTPTLLRAGTDEDLWLLKDWGRGPLTSSISEGGGFFRTDPSMALPDVMFNAGPVMFYEEGLSQPFDDAYVFGPVLLKPTSRGTVKLRSARPDVKPRIFSNYFATEEDRRSMIRGVQLTMDVAQRPALAAVCRHPAVPRTFGPSSNAIPRPSTTRRARARSAGWSTRNSVSSASRASGWPTHP
jgi:choline dehydrogenase